MRNKLILGTVQLGLNYGINNNLGKPTIKNSFDILNTAYDNGIRILDTAEAYGNSQEIIGKFHKKHPNKKFEVITKLHANASFESKNIIDYIQEDCEILKVSKLRGYMFHNYLSFKANSIQFEILQSAKQQGLVTKIGTSLYTNKELEDVIENYKGVDLIQLPFNLLDNSSKRATILQKAKDAGIEIHTRSVFLQGLFFKDTATISGTLSSLNPYLLKIKETEEQVNLNTEELALQYALSKPFIDYVLIGVDTKQQLLNNIKVSMQTGKTNFKNIDAIQVVEKELLNPANW